MASLVKATRLIRTRIGGPSSAVCTAALDPGVIARGAPCSLRGRCGRKAEPVGTGEHLCLPGQRGVPLGDTAFAIIYGYATGTFSSRKIGRATFVSLAFGDIACNPHPNHETLASFRKYFGKEFQSAFAQVLQVARKNQLTRFGTVSLDGTKIHAYACRHRALANSCTGAAQYFHS